MKNASPKVTASARRWRAFVILWFSMFVIAGGLGMVVPILPVFVRDLGASGLWLGLAFSGFAITQTPLTPIIGRLGDRLGRRRFIIVGLSMYVFIGIGLSLVNSYQAVTLLRMGMGIGAACMFPSALATIGELSPRGQEGRYMGLFMVSFTAGFGIGPLIGGVLKDAFGVEVTFLALSGAAMLALLLVAVLMPSQSASHDSEEGDVPSVHVMFRDLRVWALFVFNFTFGLGMGSVFTFIAIFMTDLLLASATLVGLVVGSRAILSSVLQPLFGRLADRIPRHYMVAAGGLLMAAAIWAIPLAPSVGILLLIFLLLGLAESAAQPASLAITTDLGRIYGYGTLIGFSNAVLIFGVLVGSLGSSLIETDIGIEYVFRVAGLATALGIAVFMAIWGRGSRRAIQPSAVL
jgi:MFS family permease